MSADQKLPEYVDPKGSSVPLDSPGHVYLGNLRKGRLCRVVGSGTRLKIAGQSPGCTSVVRTRAARSFVTKEGRAVTVRSSRERVTLSRGTVVEVNGSVPPTGPATITLSPSAVIAMGELAQIRRGIYRRLKAVADAGMTR